ncbi:MAG: hypothetical protein ACJAWL_001977 [Motiliproteus sp.]|jgi:hypothetical protein
MSSAAYRFNVSSVAIFLAMTRTSKSKSNEFRHPLVQRIVRGYFPGYDRADNKKQQEHET